MKAGSKKFYVIDYFADGRAAPYFFEKKFDPELPDYDIFNEPPRPMLFEPLYKLRVMTDDISADFLPDDNITSSGMIEVCERLGVSYFVRRLNMTLKKKRKPSKDYYLFFLQDYISILDRDKSIYLQGENFQTDENLIEQGQPTRYFYDEISSFVVSNTVNKDLFWCLEISRPVCSQQFMAHFEAANLTGVIFTPIDDRYRFEPWN